jgi:hypothetical protein
MKRYPPSFYEWLEARYPLTDTYRFKQSEFLDFGSNEYRVVYVHIYN